MPIHVLVAEDDEDLRETLLLALEAEDFVVVGAQNGAEALARLPSLPGPRVLLLDLLMPVLSGWQTIEELQRVGQLDSISIVICTSAPDLAPAGFPVVKKPICLDSMMEALRRAAR